MDYIYPQKTITAILNKSFNKNCIYDSLEVHGDNCVLAPTSELVNQINDKCLSKVNTNPVQRWATDVLNEDPNSEHSYLLWLNRAHAYSDARIPSYCLNLKVGASVTLTASVLQPDGLVNGLRMIVERTY